MEAVALEAGRPAVSKLQVCGAPLLPALTPPTYNAFPYQAGLAAAAAAESVAAALAFLTRLATGSVEVRRALTAVVGWDVLQAPQQQEGGWGPRGLVLDDWVPSGRGGAAPHHGEATRAVSAFPHPHDSDGDGAGYIAPPPPQSSILQAYSSSAAAAASSRRLTAAAGGEGGSSRAAAGAPRPSYHRMGGGGGGSAAAHHRAALQAHPDASVALRVMQVRPFDDGETGITCRKHHFFPWVHPLPCAPSSSYGYTGPCSPGRGCRCSGGCA